MSPPAAYRTIVWLLFVCILISFNTGYQWTVINVVDDEVKHLINETTPSNDDSVVSLLWGTTVTGFYIGAFIGAFSGGLVADWLGRKNGLLIFNNLFALAACVLYAVSGTAGQYSVFVIGRLLMGYSYAQAIVISAMYFVECSPVEYRGFAGMVRPAFIGLSSVLAMVLGAPFLLGNDSKWFYLMCISLPFAIFQILFGVFFKHDSPKFLFINKGSEKKAEKALMFFHGRVGSEVIEGYCREKDDAVAKVSMLEILKTRHLRWPLIIAVVVNVGLNTGGIDITRSYSKQIFQTSGSNSWEATKWTVITYLPSLLSSWINLLCLTKFDRKPILLFGIGVAGLGSFIMVVLAFLPHELLNAELVAVSLIGFGQGFRFEPIELAPQNARGKIASASYCANWGSAIFYAFTFPLFYHRVGLHAYWLNLVPNLAVLVFLGVTLPAKIKGRTVDEIAQLWKKDSAQVTDVYERF